MSQADPAKTEVLVKPQRSAWSFLSFMIALLLLGLLLVAGAGFWRVFSLSQTVSKSMMNVAQQTAADRQQLTALQDKVAGLEHQLQLQELRETQAIQEWHSAAQNAALNRDNLKVVDAQHWVQLADDYLLLTSDVPRALRLLVQAQETTSSLTDPRALALQKALSEDIATLKAVPWVNSTQLYLNLLTLQQQVEKLPLVLVPAQGYEVSSAAVSMKGLSGWEKGLENFKAALRQLVVVYHLPSTQVPPFITPDLQPYIYQNVVATLNETLWAVLNRDNAIYQASLQQAVQWTQQYFLQTAPLTKTVLSQLSDLQALSVQSTKDIVLTSPKAMQDYLR